MIENAFIPYRAYWCTPFVRWQGALSHLHSVRLAAHVAALGLDARGVDPGLFDRGVLGMTIPQQNGFYGLPWLCVDCWVLRRSADPQLPRPAQRVPG